MNNTDAKNLNIIIHYIMNANLNSIIIEINPFTSQRTLDSGVFFLTNLSRCGLVFVIYGTNKLHFNIFLF